MTGAVSQFLRMTDTIEKKKSFLSDPSELSILIHGTCSMQHLVFRTDNTSQIKPNYVSDRFLNLPNCHSNVFSGVTWKTIELV